MKTLTFHAGQVLLWLCLYLCLPLRQASAQTLPANFQRVLVTSGFNGPACLAFLPDGRILVGQQNGQLRVVKNGSLLSTPAISLPVSSSGERGLIGIAVDPGFSTNNFIYVYYTHSSGPHNRVSRFTMNGDQAINELAILDLPTLGDIFHNGGGLAFGADGKLLVATGDNKVGGNSQNLDSYLGKILRINTDGSVPAGNPFSGGPQRSRIWAYGLRNPFTTAADPVSGRFFINEVGENTWEEINDATTGGRNFGWPNAEGNCSGSCANPVYTYRINRAGTPPDGQGCAINGGTFFNGAISNYPAVYHGKYFFLDYCGGWINYINPSSPTRTAFASGLGSGAVHLKQGTDGNLYFLNRNNNSLYRIIYTGTQAPAITTQPQNISVPQGQTATFRVTATGNPAPGYQWRKDGVNIQGATAASYSITNVQPSHAGQYSVVVSNSAGSVTSGNATLTVTAPNTFPVATITTPANGASFRAGTAISFSGTGTDAEDGALPASAYEWWVDLHHANHVHPGPAIRDSITSGTFSVGAEGHTETDIWYRLYLSVTDSRGEKDTSFVELFPVVSNLGLQTVPAGLQVRVNDIPFTAPYSTPSVSGMVRPIAAVSPQTLNGVTYVFDHWAHGGAASQNITITDRDTIFTAHYRVAPAAVSIAPVQDAYVRDGTNAGITHGTADSTFLITKLALAGQLNNNRDAYLTFDLTPYGGLSSVILRAWGGIETTEIPSTPVAVFPVSNTSWTENTLTWNNKPATGTNALAQVTVASGGNVYYSWDVTNYVKSELAAGRKRISLAIKNLAQTDQRIFWNASEAATNRPELSIIADTVSLPCDPVIASTHDGNVPANVQDNNLNTRWSADGDGQWIQFCLAGSTTISAVDIAFYLGNTRTSRFDIQVSNDASNWITVAGNLQSSGTSLNLERFSFAPRTARYVRITGHGNSASTWNSYTEVRIITGSAAIAKTTQPLTLRAAPNPFGDQLQVSYTLQEAGFTTLWLYDLSGRPVQQLLGARSQPGAYNRHFPTTRLQPGLYLLKLTHNGRGLTQQVIKF
ncbi:PQQ-dependent sugar dehydrogenase [uncultured Chitinophaga sp.]|jgi:Glucose/sorbosone dehydrogenases|uniref:PQQ-dependent sugar dehydrogenase n=1 Tax=uncultured Chitinophaga sp. TaxID=339340 RepID=UPI00260D5260|nr:PQQ-dependent sugar dehydrogenase [uncultured Chitinophaga sp.]